MRTSKRPTFQRLLVLAVLYYIAVKLSLVFAVTPAALVMFWIPNGLLLAALLHHHFHRYAYFSLAIVAAEIAADYPTYSLIEASLFGILNLSEVTVAFLLLRHWGFNSRFAKPADLGKFVVAGPILSAAVAAFAAGGVNRYFGEMHSSYLEYVRVWWFSDAIGLMIVTPLVLSFWPTRKAMVSEPVKLRWPDAVTVVLGITVVVLLVVADQGRVGELQVRPVWLLPFALYVAARFDPRVTAIVVVLFSGIVLFVTVNQQQPFGNLSIRETVLQAQQVIFIMCATSAGLAALLSQLRADARQLEARVAKRTSALRIANDRLRKLAATDALTGALNRRNLTGLIASEMERHQRHGHPLSILMFDVDHFKAVNDHFGHSAGDTVLRKICDLTRKLSRSNDSLFRYGGEEFVMVAPQTDQLQAMALANRIRETVENSQLLAQEQASRITASFGIATFDSARDAKPEDLLRRADEALYAAKAAGRNRVTASE